jgi:hypothetical protein
MEAQLSGLEMISTHPVIAAASSGAGTKAEKASATLYAFSCSIAYVQNVQKSTKIPGENIKMLIYLYFIMFHRTLKRETTKFIAN